MDLECKKQQSSEKNEAMTDSVHKKIIEIGEVHSWKPKVGQAHQTVCILQEIWGRSQHSQHE
jgi:hypothetical protein